MALQNAIWRAWQTETVLNAAPVLEFMKCDNERLDPIIPLIQFGLKHCHVDQAASILDRIIDAASQYKPEDGDSGMWRKMRDQIEAGLQSIGA